LLTRQQILDLAVYAKGIGVPLWEKMPVTENCPVAEELKSSLTGRLLPLSRFCLLTEKGLHYSEGLAHRGYKDGIVDPSVSADFSSNDPKAIWVDTEKRPWRLLTSLLSFFSQANNRGFDCYQLRLSMRRVMLHIQSFGIWSGGLRVSSNAGEQYVSGSDDFVESVIQLQSGMLGKQWFANLQLEMEGLDGLSRTVYSAALSYFKNQNMEAKGQAGQAANLFWQLCERRFQELVNACGDYDKAHAMRRIFAGFAYKAYDAYCPKDTARQLDAWAKNRPNLGKYLKNPTKETA
jgi:CRISPR system Cascade subunit CasA